MQLGATVEPNGGKIEFPNLIGPRAASRQSLRKREEAAAKLSSSLRTGGRSGPGSRWATGVQVVQ